MDCGVWGDHQFLCSPEYEAWKYFPGLVRSGLSRVGNVKELEDKIGKDTFKALACAQTEGVILEMRKAYCPATFVVAPGGKLIFWYIGQTATDYHDNDALLEAVKSYLAENKGSDGEKGSKKKKKSKKNKNKEDKKKDKEEEETHSTSQSA